MKTQAICPTCGSICGKGSSDEGTNYFIPKKIAGMKMTKELKHEILDVLNRWTWSGTITRSVHEDLATELAEVVAKNLHKPLVSRRLPTTEDIKRWYALLDSKNDESLQKDMEATFG